MTLEVIGAGFGRTGTESMRQALGMIGLGPCYHMFEVLPHEDRVAMWRGIAKGDKPDWDKVFDGYRSTVDWPAAAFWRELAVHYPDAKILLTMRDSESWYRSMDKTILQVIRNSTDPDSLGKNLIGLGAFGGRWDDKDAVIGAYEKNVADVKAAFGPDRLLVYELGSGWEPLCTFFDRLVPDEPYPRSNSSDDFQANLGAAEDARGD